MPEKSVKYLLLSLLVPVAKSICLLRCRNQGYEKIIVPEPVYPTYSDEIQLVNSGTTEAVEPFQKETVVEETVELGNVEEKTSEE